MATTSLWAVNDNLKRVLDYASDEDKTESQDDLSQVLAYASNNEKTNQYVTGINCSPQNVYDQMMNTKTKALKIDGVQAFHGYQSFASNELDAATCHKIGVELAHRMWGDDFEVLVCTHTNTDNLHNHFVVNSVSWRTRKKFDNSHEDYRRFMKLSDEICKEYGLSIIENPINAKMNYKEFKAMIDGKPYIRGIVKDDVEMAINSARTYKQFMNNLTTLGYSIPNPNRKYLTVITPDGHHVRLDKIKPVGTYSKESIINRILDNELIKWESIHPESYTSHVFKQADEYNKKKKYQGIKALYIKYQFMLGILPKHNPSFITHPSIKMDVLYLDKISKEAELLESHQFQTVEQLNQYISECEEKIKLLQSYRKGCYSKIERCKNLEKKEMLIHDRENYTQEIKKYKSEIDLCNDIKKRSGVIEDKINQIEMEEENERIRRDSRSNGKNDTSRY